MADKEIVDKANALARIFYRMQGHEVKHGYKFQDATHPQERMCWDMACAAFEMLTSTDVEDALSDVEAEEGGDDV